MEHFRLLHLSDFHFAQEVSLGDLVGLMRNKLMGPPADENLATFITREAYWRSRTQSFNGILVTGDLATTGILSDLDRAFEFIDSRAIRFWLNAFFRPTIRSIGLPIFLLPGNHDRFRNYGALPGCPNFDRVFGFYWSCSGGSMSFPLMRSGDEHLGIAAADFTLRHTRDATRPKGVWGQGRAYRSVIDALKRETQNLRDSEENVAIIWAIHFPPGLVEVEAELQLIDGDLVLDAAEECGVEFIFCGHLHRRITPRKLRERVSVCCAGSATQVQLGQENSFHEIIVTVNQGQIVELDFASWLWDPAEGKFSERVESISG